MLIGTLSLPIGCIALVWIVMQVAPSFGGDLTSNQKSLFEQLENFNQGKFRNRQDVPKQPGFKKTLELAYKFFTTRVINGRPSQNLPLVTHTKQALITFDKTRLIWLGHSTFLLQHLGKNILIDPMFGPVPAPFTWLGDKRFSETLPFTIADLPHIDAVLISHDHYDHLDYKSIQELHPKVKYFFVPLGVENHLLRWGVPQEKISTLNWWEKTNSAGFEFVCTPAQHFSGRKMSNSQETLWASWVIKADNLSLYFSGDSGYDSHFKAIGEKYGPFDLALLECGQYNPMWADIHMFPEETAQAGIDLNAKKIIPIHWGAFKLAMHAWDEPVQRVVKAANEKQIAIEVPVIGASILQDTDAKPLDFWWNID